jgi:uncharacterized MAPEG superfamily protein
MRNGNLSVNTALWVVVSLGALIRLSIAGILFTAVVELDTPALRGLVWSMGMLIVFSIIHKFYKLIRFTKLKRN